MDLYISLIFFINFQHSTEDISTTEGGTTTSQTHLITNGFCAFSPTSTKGKWIFIVQTIILSFTPIVILLVQNGTSFYSLMKEKDEIIHKDNMVSSICKVLIIQL